MDIDEARFLIGDLALLFTAKSMDELDAADFKDKAGETWSLVERARELIGDSE
jgi:hypothetical protein